MLREIEFAAARTEDIEAGEAWVLLRIPLHKTAQGGERELTARQLRCACGVRSRPMCPAHAAMRHVSRLKVAGFWRRGGPLFPDAAGATWAKGETVMLFRRVLLAAGVTLTMLDHEGRLVQLFAGHAARVAGAAWLASKGVPTAIIQLLGRWSSTAVERCRRPQPGAPVVSRHRPVETVKVHRPSRWTPRWRPARRLSRTAPRLRKDRLRSTGVPGGA